MGNFGNLAGGYNVRTVELKTSDDLIAACSNPKFKALILTAPSRRLAEAQTDPRTYSAEELAAIAAFNAGGGTVILAGWSDNYENYDVIQNNPAIKHMAATQNEVLQALGSSLRISDDATYDDVRSAGRRRGQVAFVLQHLWPELPDRRRGGGPPHPYDKLYTPRYSATTAAPPSMPWTPMARPPPPLPAAVSPRGMATATTYSVDVDQDGLGGANVAQVCLCRKRQPPDGHGPASSWRASGMVMVSGAAFMSNFEVQATISDNGSEKNYSNYKICENLLRLINPVQITRHRRGPGPDRGRPQVHH